MNVAQKLIGRGWFQTPGAYVLVDGQYGSTGKGLLAGLLAEAGAGAITHCTTNAGPNSGHTAYFGRFDGTGTGSDEVKIVTQQVPVASVVLEMMGSGVDTVINAGAIVDEDILGREVSEWLNPYAVYLHPLAALITDEARQADQAVVGRIAGTGKGVGPALAAKVGRSLHAVVSASLQSYGPPPGRTWDNFWDWTQDTVFVETAQGFSLGINSERFYPHTTSRECSVMQALADARIPAQMLQKVVACYRTFPIRVGNSPEGGYSGDVYSDQKEISFSDIGQPEEITTVTKRVRRLFTWSREQFRDSVAANRPDVIFLNFCNYMSPEELDRHVELMILDYLCVIGRKPEAVLLGYGPRSSDIKLYEPR